MENGKAVSVAFITQLQPGEAIFSTKSCVLSLRKISQGVSPSDDEEFRLAVRMHRQVGRFYAWKKFEENF